MSTPNSLTITKVDMRTRILESAIKLFIAKGFDGVTMRELAKSVDITPGAIYHHFPDKRKLHLAALHYAYKVRSEMAISVLSNKKVSAQERLRSFILRLCERLYYDPEFRRLLQRDRLEWDVDYHQEILGEIYEAPYIVMRDFLSELGVDPAFDKAMLSTFLFGLVMHTYDCSELRRSLSDYKPQQLAPEKVTDQIMKLLLNGIMPAK